jgi:hypothetical protein
MSKQSQGYRVKTIPRTCGTCTHSALKSGNEILINGEYYAFHVGKFKDILSALLGIKIVV